MNSSTSEYILQIPLNDDPIITFSQPVTSGVFSFRSQMNNIGGSGRMYFNFGSTGDPSNWSHVIQVVLNNAAGINVTAGNSATSMNINIYGVTGYFDYRMEFSPNEQKNYINDVLVYTSNISIAQVRGINPYAYFNDQYIDNIKLTSNGSDILNIDMDQYAQYVGPVSYTHLTLPTKRIV